MPIETIKLIEYYEDKLGSLSSNIYYYASSSSNKKDDIEVVNPDITFAFKSISALKAKLEQLTNRKVGVYSPIVDNYGKKVYLNVNDEIGEYIFLYEHEHNIIAYVNKEDEENFRLGLTYRVESCYKSPGFVLAVVSESVDYWRERCELAENYIELTPFDPDITPEQFSAWVAYQGFIGYKEE